jgi:single-strand DNA-binding protein
MSSVCRVFIIGNLGRDPESKTVGQNQSLMTNFSVATSHRGADGQEQTSWHNVTAWAKTAQNCQQYLKKGAKVCVEGRIDYQEGTNRDGVKMTYTKIIADRVTFLDTFSKSKDDQPTARPQSTVDRSKPVSPFTPQEEMDLPF